MSNPTVDYPWRYMHLTDTALLQASRTVLHNLVLNHGDDLAGAIHVYDGVDNTGTEVAVIGMQGINPVTLGYDILLRNGLYVEFDGVLTTADVTVTYV